MGDPLAFQIIHHGAVEGVTGSCHELRLADGRSVLVDCGLFQGAETAGDGARAGRLEVLFPVSNVQALVVTHVHLDHVGRIPHLLAAGFAGPILCSEASARLLPMVLEDALKVGVTRDEGLIARVLDLVRSRTVALPYGVWREIDGRGRSVLPAGPTLRMRLSPAGHILGSAYVEFDIRMGLVHRSVLFSGDLGAPWTPLLPAPRPPYGAEVVVLESTYGDREHEDRRERRPRLQAILEHALANGGTVLIPAFSIGRTQELLYELEEIIHQHKARAVAPGVKWGDMEIVLDSPLAADFTAGYQSLAAHWDAEAKRKVARGRHPLNFAQVTTIGDHETHLRMVDFLARTRRPAIVIAASGMCSGGRVVNYLKAMLGDGRHDVLFTGYQAAGTPGRDIQTHGPKGGWVELDGRRYDIRAGVHTLGGFSAHADQSDLVNFVARMRVKPRQVRLVHGDAGAKQALADALHSRFPGMEVVVP
ncbi:MAG: MBL fold metallo-hydrolase [Pseudomonadota bacterium]